MRLGMFHPAFGEIRGAELLIAAQAQHFRTLGAAPELVTFTCDEARWRPYLDGVGVRVVPKRHWSDLFLGLTPLGKLQRRGARAAKALVDFDLVIAHNFPASAMLGAAPIRGRKVWQCNEPPRSLHPREANPYLTAHSATPGEAPKAEAIQAFRKDLQAFDASMARGGSLPKRRAFDLASVGGLDLIYGISEFTRDNAQAIYGRCRAEVIYPLVRFPEGGWRRSGLDRSVRRVLVHSRLEAPKNIDTVIRGFQRFRASAPVPCELHVVGDGPLRARLEDLAQELLPGGEVRFHGFLPEATLRTVYESCDVFALLPLDEPFGMVFPEAAAKGLLLVGPDHGGPLEILAGGELGWVVDAFDAQALAEALTRVWSLEDAEVDRRRELADRACRSRFGAESIGRQLARLLRED
jgi:glycosyltransferase involved in cell wall biosynthesis